MAACPLCSARKGKRACPALRGTICSACCGEKRVVEIACPSGCSWLGRGAENDMRREATSYFHQQEPEKAMRWLRTVERLGFLLEMIERAVAGTAPRSVGDADLLPALRSVHKTLESEAKGVLYEDVPTSPTAQALSRDILAGLGVLRNAMEDPRAAPGLEGARLPHWGAAEAAECVAVLAERCEFHLAGKAERGSLLEHLRRVYTPGAGLGVAEPPLIVLS